MFQMEYPKLGEIVQIPILDSPTDPYPKPPSEEVKNPQLL